MIQTADLEDKDPVTGFEISDETPLVKETSLLARLLARTILLKYGTAPKLVARSYLDTVAEHQRKDHGGHILITKQPRGRYRICQN